MDNTKLVALRCAKCNKIIGKVSEGATAEIKCKCGTMNVIRLKPEPAFSERMDNIKRKASA